MPMFRAFWEFAFSIESAVLFMDALLQKVQVICAFCSYFLSLLASYLHVHVLQCIVMQWCSHDRIQLPSNDLFSLCMAGLMHAWFNSLCIFHNSDRCGLHVCLNEKADYIKMRLACVRVLFASGR